MLVLIFLLNVFSWNAVAQNNVAPIAPAAAPQAAPQVAPPVVPQAAPQTNNAVPTTPDSAVQPYGPNAVPSPATAPGAAAAPAAAAPGVPTGAGEIIAPTAATPAPKPKGENTIAHVSTTMGNFDILLYTIRTPKTTKNFIDLVSGQREFVDAKTSRKSKRPFYDGLMIHKVVRGFVIQMGCPFGTGRGGPGYTIADEIVPTLSHNRAGIVSMANAGVKDSGGSQFFITLEPHPELDGKYAIFGEVTKGMDTLKKISAVPVGPTERPIKRIIIKSITID